MFRFSIFSAVSSAVLFSVSSADALRFSSIKALILVIASGLSFAFFLQQLRLKYSAVPWEVLWSCRIQYCLRNTEELFLDLVSVDLPRMRLGSTVAIGGS